MDKKQITKEERRLTTLLERAGTPRQKQEALAPVVHNLAWQRLKLEEALEEMKDEKLTCTYNNGGNQCGTRENPFFKAYISLWKAYMLGFEKYIAALPKDMQEEVNGQALDLVAQVMELKKVSG